MADWDALKLQYPDSLLAVRLGDFYEFFFEDARVVARELGVTLTHRRETPMSGFPWHSAESRFGDLVRAGFTVSVADFNPSTGKREVV